MISKIRNNFLISVFFGILLLSTNCSHMVESKYSAEEAGYFEEILPILNSASLIGTNKMVLISCSPTCMYRSVVIEAMQKRDWSAVKRDLAATIPPSTLEDLHNKIVEIVNIQESFEKLNVSSYNDTGAQVRTNLHPDSEEVTSRLLELKNAAANLRSLKSSFDTEASKRPAQKVNGDALNLTYHPPVVPISMQYSTSGEFSIEASPGVDTSIGSFGANVKEAKGIKKLIIRSEGKARYFKLDRAFRLFIPSDFGIEVANDGSEQMTIEVKKKNH